jgi:hypothetical protein
MNVDELAAIDEYVAGIEGLTDFEPWAVPSWYRDRWASARPDLVQPDDPELIEDNIALYLRNNRIWEYGMATIGGEEALLVYCDRYHNICEVAIERRCGIELVQSETPFDEIVACLTKDCLMSRPHVSPEVASCAS